MTSIEPLNYILDLVTDMERFSFSGTLRIEARAAAPVSGILLHAADLAVWRCGLAIAEKSHPCVFRLDPLREELHVAFPFPVSGTIVVEIDYQGTINDRMAGFYRSSYRHFGFPSHIAVSQFQESDARRAFPCLDLPHHKAVFHIRLTLPESWTALSNTAAIEETRLPGGLKRVAFEPTPPISTYLVFLGAGRFDRRGSPTDRRVSALTLPGALDQTAAALEFGSKALGYCEAYFDIPYPLSKLDLIAVPDFAFGAMENWGAITFRENLLLHSPQVTSRAALERICEVIAHEIVHQWFGNLVTPARWTYLWLNESFATYFGYGVVEHFHPDWEIWSSFLTGQTESALSRDGLPGTPAIELPGETVIINASTAPIIYSKGGSILRQIEAYIGAAAFQEGLRHYLKRHAHGCAESRDLWQALELVSRRPVGAIMKNWVSQAGHPELAVRREGDALVLTQRRFSYRPAADNGQRWLIPLAVLVFTADGESRRVEHLMEGGELRLDLGSGAAAFKINSGHTGFYRTRYLDRQDLDRLGPLVRSGALPPEDRWGLQSDLFAQMRAGNASLSSFLAFAAWYDEERSGLPLFSLAGHLSAAFLVAGAPGRQAVATLARPFCERALERIGWEPQAGEPHARAALRERLIWHAALYDSTPATDFAQRRFRELQAGKAAVHPDLHRCVLQVGALKGNAEDAHWLTERFLAAPSEHERMNLLAAMGAIGDPAMLDTVGSFVLQRVPDRNRFIPLAALAENPITAPHMWDWYQSHRKTLEQSHPLLYERIIASIVPLGGLEEPESVRRFLEAYAEERPAVQEVVRLSLERLAVNRHLRAQTQTVQD